LMNLLNSSVLWWNEGDGSELCAQLPHGLRYAYALKSYTAQKPICLSENVSEITFTYSKLTNTYIAHACPYAISL
jgi:hypothetical protein